MSNNAIDTMSSSIATKVAYGSSVGTGFLAWIGTNHFAILSSFIIALLAFVISTYLKLEERTRKQERHRLDVEERKARIAHLSRQPELPADIPEEADTVY